jgi:hypothetical protein
MLIVTPDIVLCAKQMHISFPGSPPISGAVTPILKNDECVGWILGSIKNGKFNRLWREGVTYHSIKVNLVIPTLLKL